MRGLAVCYRCHVHCANMFKYRRIYAPLRSCPRDARRYTYCLLILRRRAVERSQEIQAKYA